MSYFTPDFQSFMSELVENNNRDWFNENKKQYIKFVKEPFEEFVSALLNRMSHENPALEPVQPKDCIFRIYRDTRFSKDKTPYKTHVSAVIGEGGRKERTKPGIYVQLSSEEVRMYSGAFDLDKHQLLKVRSAIASDIPAFQALYKNVDFAKHFGEIRGEKHKRLTGEFKALSEKEPLLFNKQFYYFTKWPAEFSQSENIISDILNRHKITTDLGQFFARALN